MRVDQARGDLVLGENEPLQVAARLELSDHCVRQPQAFGDVDGVWVAHARACKRR